MTQDPTEQGNRQHSLHAEHSQEIMTEQEAAAYLGVSISGLRNWRNHQQGPKFYRLGPVDPVYPVRLAGVAGNAREADTPEARQCFRIIAGLQRRPGRSYRRRFEFLKEPALYRLIALSVIGTHLYQEFEYFGYLFVHSPEKRCGKTRLLDVVLRFVRHALPQRLRGCDCASAIEADKNLLHKIVFELSEEK